MTDKTPGQVAYEAYWRGDLPPRQPWRLLHPRQQARWEAAAQAVRDAPPRFACALDAAVHWGHDPGPWRVAARRWTEAGRTQGYAEYGLTRVADGQWCWVLESDLRQEDAP